MVGLPLSSLMSTGCVVPLRGDWCIFCHAGSGRVGRVWSAREKSLENSALAGNWTRTTERADSETHSFSHWVIMTDTIRKYLTNNRNNPCRSLNICSDFKSHTKRRIKWRSYRCYEHNATNTLKILNAGVLRRFFTPSSVRSASNRTLETDGLPPKMGWKSVVGSASDVLSDVRPFVSQRQNGYDQPIKWSSTEYLAMFTHFRPHTRIIGKGNLFVFATILAQLTAWCCTGQRGNL